MCTRPIRRHAARARRGASALETVLLLAAIGIPLMGCVFLGIRILSGHYGMVTALNALPFP